MLFCSVAFSVVVKRLILYGTSPEAISANSLHCSLLKSHYCQMSFWALFLGSQEQRVIQPSCTEELQCSSSAPAQRVLSIWLLWPGLCLQLGTESGWHCQPSKQPGHFFSLWCLSLSHGLIPHSFLSPWERPGECSSFYTFVIWSALGLSCCVLKTSEWGIWGESCAVCSGMICCCLSQHRVTKFSCHLGSFRETCLFKLSFLTLPSICWNCLVLLYLFLACTVTLCLCWGLCHHPSSAWNLGSTALLSPACHTSSPALAELLSMTCIPFC